MPTHEKMIDISKVLLVNTAAIGITIANIKDGLTIISLTIAIVYTLWKWQRDYKKEKKNDSTK